MAETGAEHWADRVAARIAASDGAPVISTGISPSGEIHVGNMREVLTGDAVFRALRDRGASPHFNFVADSLDELRRVYPFLDPARYAPLVGMPLARIPCPCGNHESYAEHFLEPFLEALALLHVEVEVERADRLYASGRMNAPVLAALEGRDAIARILAEVTGREVGPDWSPFNPLCPECGKINGAKVTAHSRAAESVDFACRCGARGTVPIAGGGKLTWRVDWPARWVALGVSVEPFGKDHSTRGGSYDSGARIAREVFGAEPPFPIAYEWVRLEGRGDMSSSKGNVLSVARMLEVVPPEVLRYLILRERPERSIRFDPGLPLLQLVDEVDDAHARGRDERALELSRAGGFEPIGVPFKHLVTVAQTADFDPARAREILARTGYPSVAERALAGRLGYARRWLADFAPDDLRFAVQRELPAAAAALGPEQRAFLLRLAERLRDGMDAEAIHKVVYELAQGGSARPAVLFEAIYVALLGKTRGPRAGRFIEMLGPGFCAERFRQAGGS